MGLLAQGYTENQRLPMQANVALAQAYIIARLCE